MLFRSLLRQAGGQAGGEEEGLAASARTAIRREPDGLFFMHIFCHRRWSYFFTDDRKNDWMGRYFFTGGLMPTEHLLKHFDQHITVTRQWSWDGTHYQRTSEAWLANLDARRRDVMPILEATYGKAEAGRWFHRWRMFFLAVAELFGFADGREWFVSHSLLQRRGT